MNWYWVAAAGMLLSLSVGVTAVVLQRFYFQYAVIDIMAIIGFMIFTSTLVSLILTRLGFAFKRLLARSQWADMLGIITFRNSALMSQRPSGCFPCQPSPTQPAFCPDNSGDMLTIFEDYSQYPPQPRRLFDTHRLSPTTSPEGGLIPDVVPRVCLPTDSEEALLYVVRSNGTFVHLDHIVSSNNCCSRGQVQDDLPPPYHTVLATTFDHEEPPPPYGEEMIPTEIVVPDDGKQQPSPRTKTGGGGVGGGGEGQQQRTTSPSNQIENSMAPRPHPTSAESEKPSEEVAANTNAANNSEVVDNHQQQPQPQHCDQQRQHQHRQRGEPPPPLLLPPQHQQHHHHYQQQPQVARLEHNFNLGPSSDLRLDEGDKRG